VAELIDLTGQVFGRLTVVKRAEGMRPTAWECTCVCGAKAVVRAHRLIGGNTKSCGCKLREHQAQMRFRHRRSVSGQRSGLDPEFDE
jgi:hypothetical protein